MSARTAGWYRGLYEDISGELTVAADTDDTTLVTAKTTPVNHTIFIQRVIFYVTTDAAVSMSFEDSASTPVSVAKIPTSPGVDTRWDFDFGEDGLPLTAGKNFVMNVSATGLAGRLKWYGYQKRTGVGAA
jgi:hypothetical protein